MTDVNPSEFQSISSRFSEENNSSFILNQSHVPMEIDLEEEIAAADTTKSNGYRSPSIENGNTNVDEEDKEDVFHQGNPVLNKSFDVLPQIKDDDTPSADPISVTDTNILDTTVELSNNSDASILEDQNARPSENSDALLTNQFSVEYPYIIPQPVENTQPSSPSPSPPANLIEPITTMTKSMQLNVNKTLEEPSTPTTATEKTFDTNTFVLKKKERRKVATPTAEASLNATSEVTSPDPPIKQSSFNTPSTSLDTATASQRATQPPFTDPTRIM